VAKKPKKLKKEPKESKKESIKMYYQGEFPFYAQRVFRKISETKYLMSSEIVIKLSSYRKAQPTTHRINKILELFKEYDYVKEFGIITGTTHQCKSKSKQYFFEIDKKERILKVIQKNAKVEKHRTIKGKKLTKIKCLLICKFCKRSVLVKLRGNSKILAERCWDLSFNGTLIALSFLEDEESWDLIKNSNNEILRLAKILLENQKKYLVDILQERLRKKAKEEPDLIPIAKSWYKEMLKKILKFKIDKSNQPEFVKYQTELELEQQSEIIMSARHGHFTRKFG